MLNHVLISLYVIPICVTDCDKVIANTAYTDIIPNAPILF